MKNKYIFLSIMVIVMGLVLVAGGTYAYLTSTVTVNNGNYSGTVACFDVNYSIDNGDSTQNITGTLFPTLGAAGGLSGKAYLAVVSTCNISGTGSLVLHINTETVATYGTKSTPRCESKFTYQELPSYTTESACTDPEVNGIWRYPDSYCEDRTTLEYLANYRTSQTCAANNGTWVTSGSSLKFAVYNNPNATGTPLAVKRFDSTTIGQDVTLYSGFPVTFEGTNLYVFVWLDGNLAGNDFAELPFDGYIKASVTQNNTVPQKKYYYAFGDPTTSSPTDYNEIYQNGTGHRVFVRVFEDNISNPSNITKEVCIIKDGELGCFQNDSSTWQQTASAIELFYGSNTCSYDAANVDCYDDSSLCRVDSTGYVYCYDDDEGEYCDVDGGGLVGCS